MTVIIVRLCSDRQPIMAACSNDVHHAETMYTLQEEARRRAERGANDSEAVKEVLGAAVKTASKIAKNLL